MSDVDQCMSGLYDQLLQPERLASRSDVLARPSVVPPMPGVYAWYFRNPPAESIQLARCWTWQDKYLLYVGISPNRPPTNGKAPSSQNLRTRLRYHMRGNAYGSTLRLTLGCLLSESLQIELRRVGSGIRMTFSTGEAKLSEWMEQNAFVTWYPHPQPWRAESEAIDELYLPLNLDQNQSHHFYATLSDTRRIAKERARTLPVVSR